MIKVAYVAGDDWCGVYIDGLLKDEGHSIGCLTLLELVALIGPFEVERIDANQPWLEDEGSLPEHLKDVVRA